MRIADGQASSGRNSSSRTALSRAAPRRSLLDALAEAGLGEAEITPSAKAAIRRARGLDAAVAERASLFAPRRAEPDEPEQSAPVSSPEAVATPPAVTEAKVRPQSSGVVSPPPWVRAARRGRWHALAQNTFGWAVTLVVVGGFVGLAGHFLAVKPTGSSATLQASATGR
jgi:hypothetical protein